MPEKPGLSTASRLLIFISRPRYGSFFTFQSRLTRRLAQLFASFFVLQLNRLPWPLPEVIVPVPNSRIEMWSEKQQGSVWIARELGHFLNVPIALPLEYGKKVRLKKRARPLPEKKVLLLTTDLRESHVLQQARWCIQALFTKNIYSLALIEKRNLF